MSEPPSSRLLGHRGFVRFWVADGVSNLGTFVSGLAVQLLLIETLGADQQEVGLVRSAQWLPYLLFGLLAGVLVDRARRKPLLVGADALSAVLSGGVGALALTGHLSVGLLAAVVFVVGSASMVSSAANQSYLPSLVPPPLLPVANARLHKTYTAAQSAGPLVGGLLVRALSAPVAVLVDALSYAVSAVVVAGIRDSEREPDRPASPSASRRICMVRTRSSSSTAWRTTTTASATSTRSEKENGRTQRVFWSRVARDAGWDLSWRRVSAEHKNAASRVAMEQSDLQPLRELFAAIATRREPWLQTVGRDALDVAWLSLGAPASDATRAAPCSSVAPAQSSKAHLPGQAHERPPGIGD